MDNSARHTSVLRLVCALSPAYSAFAYALDVPISLPPLPGAESSAQDGLARLDSYTERAVVLSDGAGIVTVVGHDEFSLRADRSIEDERTFGSDDACERAPIIVIPEPIPGQGPHQRGSSSSAEHRPCLLIAQREFPCT